MNVYIHKVRNVKEEVLSRGIKRITVETDDGGVQITLFMVKK